MGDRFERERDELLNLDLVTEGDCQDSWREGFEAGRAAQLKEVIAGNAAAPKRYHLSEQNGKAVQEILNRYVSEELKGQLLMGDPARVREHNQQIKKDIDYIEGLAKLFD